MARILLAAALSFIAPAACCASAGPDFNTNILPILQKHCQSCHRPGEIGPMSLLSYKDVRPWASAIREAVKLRKMPPWFADPRWGHFSNDPRLTDDEIASVIAWADAGAPEGEKGSGPLPIRWAGSWTISPDLVIQMPRPFTVPAKAVVDYQYVILHLPFTFDRWVKAIEIRPSDRSVVHHAVLYVRPPNSKWLRDLAAGVVWSPPRENSAAVAASRATTEDILAVYSPGSQASVLPKGMAKRIPAGSDLILQLHYTSKAVDAVDQAEVGLVMTAQRPLKQVFTLQMGQDNLRIPPGAADYRATVSGSVPQEALLLSLFPHMHLRGAAFDFDRITPEGRFERLLSVRPYNFNWQLTYKLAEPILLEPGTRLRWTGYFDNSRNNPTNPDPNAEVTWGEQSFDEMMIGFFDVAVDPSLTKADFFVRH